MITSSDYKKAKKKSELYETVASFPSETPDSFHQIHKNPVTWILNA